MAKSSYGLRSCHHNNDHRKRATAPHFLKSLKYDVMTSQIALTGRGRRCCRYNEDDPVMCPDRETCLVYRSGTLAPVSLDSCRVSSDSKKDAGGMSAEQGLQSAKPKATTYLRRIFQMLHSVWCIRDGL